MTSGFVNLGTPPIRPTEPFAAFDAEIIRTIEKAICEAWNLLRCSARIDLSTANETDITKELQDSIIDVMNSGSVNGFVPELFNHPSRDGSVMDYSGNIQKRSQISQFICQNLCPYL